MLCLPHQSLVAGAVYLHPGLEHRYYDPFAYGHIAVYADQVTDPLQLLAALPVMWSLMDSGRLTGAGSVAVIALEALQNRRGQWSAVFERWAFITHSFLSPCPPCEQGV